MKKRIILSRLLFVLYLAAIAFMCFASSGNFPDVQKSIFGIPIDKAVHFMMFFPFPIMTFLSLDTKHKKAWQCIGYTILVMIIGCALAGGTEMLQGLTRTRTPDRLDFIADCAALAASSLIVFAVDLLAKK